MSTLPPAKPSIGRHRILGRSETRLHFLASRPRSSPCLKAKVKKLGRRITVGENKAYDTADHLSNLRAINVTPHVAQNDSITLAGKRCRSAIDGTHHAAPRLRHVAIVPGDDRMHLGLGQEIGPPAATNSRAESIAGSGPGRSLQRLPHRGPNRLREKKPRLHHKRSLQPFDKGASITGE